ncbi:MAG: glucuronate isomerase [bacterium]|nr:glucuronate isomerase [bacterium]
MNKPAPSLSARIAWIIAQTPITDIHTHLYPPTFGPLLLRGIDELLTYHYLVAEMFRWRTDLDYAAFFALPRAAQADIVWHTLFLDHAPVSESARGVLTTLHACGLNVAARDLAAYRRFFAGLSASEHVDLAMRLAKVKTVVLTNDPFDDAERACWDKGAAVDARFHTALRIDLLFADWPAAVHKLRAMGFRVTRAWTPATARALHRFLDHWITRMQPLYLMASLPPAFRAPSRALPARILDEVVLPAARAHQLPFAMMIGCNRQVNPDLRLAGDGIAPVDMATIEHVVAKHRAVNFMVTLLTHESQQALCILARKFRNLLPFGCWWFLNSPLYIEELTRMRLEWLGASMIPQHSDARVLDQIIYKWAHTKTILARVLADKYGAIEQTGWRLGDDELRREIAGLLGGTFWRFLGRADA